MKLLTNARIYTFAGELPAASAIAIDREWIIDVGETGELRRRFNNQVEEIDLNRNAVIPGMVDAHIHLDLYALGLQKIDCETTTKAECLRRVEERALQTPPGEWILGHGWNQNNWAEGYGTVQDLDAAAPRNPVFLTAKSLHAAWVNNQALKIAGIQQETEDPPNGTFGRDQQVRLTGILYENAVSLVEKIIPAPSVEMVASSIQAAQEDLWKKGLTGVHDFDRQRCFSALQLLHGRGLLRLRVLKSIPFENFKQAVEIGLRSFSIGKEAVDSGLSLAVHAIGDRANHEVLNGLDRLREYQNQNPSQPMLPHRIEHVQIIHPADAARLSALGVVASMQPIHATSDMEMSERYWGKRSAWAYGFKTQLDHGARLVFGSDAPVESPNPFLGVHAAVTRRRRDGEPGVQGWHPEQRLTVQQTLEAYTLTPAAISGMGNRLGKIAPGYLADLVVLDQDPFTCQPEDLNRIKPVKTMVAGEWVFEA